MLGDCQMMTDAKDRDWNVCLYKNRRTGAPGGLSNWTEVRASMFAPPDEPITKGYRAFYTPPAAPQVLLDQIQRDLTSQ